ncbi:MAG: hypothetical protein ACYTF6_13395 [Planctomycetota bacterium]|jgi:hypothetical protein
METPPENLPEDLRHRVNLGEILCGILNDAIAFEQTKKRKRMIQEADLRPLSPLRINQDVNEAVKRINIYQPSPPATKRLKILKSALEAHSRGILDISSIEPWMCWELDLTDEGGMDELLSKPNLFAERLNVTIKRTQESKELEVDKKGGRRTDPRLNKLISDLAFTYRAYTGYRATYSQANDASGQQSPFFWFVARVLQHFFQDGEEAEWATRTGALELAIRRISEFERGY